MDICKVVKIGGYDLVPDFNKDARNKSVVGLSREGRFSSLVGSSRPPLNESSHEHGLRTTMHSLLPSSSRSRTCTRILVLPSIGRSSCLPSLHLPIHHISNIRHLLRPSEIP